MWPQPGDAEKLPADNHLILSNTEKFLKGGVFRAHRGKISRPAAADPMGQGMQFKMGEGHSTIFPPPWPIFRSHGNHQLGSVPKIDIRTGAPCCDRGKKIGIIRRQYFYPLGDKIADFLDGFTGVDQYPS